MKEANMTLRESIPPPVVPEKMIDGGFETLLAAAEKAYRMGYRAGWKSGWRAGLAQYIQPKKKRKAVAVRQPRKPRAGSGADAT